MISNNRQIILQVSKSEFLNKGFDGASLREIANKAGLTTGAIYGYFKNKDDLFSNLVKDVAQEFLDLQEKTHLKYTNYQTGYDKGQDFQEINPFEDILFLIDYIYEHFDIFKLLICHSENTSYRSYFSQLVSRHIDSAEKMIHGQGLGEDVKNIDKEFVEIITNSYLSDIFEIVRRNMARKKARNYVIQLSIYYGSGWLAMAKADF